MRRMSYFVAFCISLITLIGLKQVAHAVTSVNVSNNTSGGSNTHVVVNSNVTSSSNTTVTNTSDTNVHIESNGEVKDFNANGDESVDWTSEDGKSSVKINTNGAKITPKPNHDQDDSNTPTTTPAESTLSAKTTVLDHKDIPTHKFNLAEFFHKLFTLLGFAK